jgi:hypothetical protein
MTDTPPLRRLQLIIVSCFWNTVYCFPSLTLETNRLVCQVCTDDAAVTALDVRAFDWRHTVNQRLKNGSLIQPDLKEYSGLVAWHGLTVHCVNWGVVDKDVMAIQPRVKVTMQ